MPTPARRLAQRAAAAHRNLLVEPVSTVDAPYHRSAGFYVRVGGLAAVATALLAILALRLWSLQVIQGPAYTRLATQQSFRWVDLIIRVGWIATALCSVVAIHDVLFAHIGPVPVALALMGCVVGALSVTMLVLVLRELLASAMNYKAELSEVV